MINIHEKLWFVVEPENSDNLAYMTYYVEDKAFEKRKETGMTWAGRRAKEELNPKVIDNTPVSGFSIGDSVSRWSTSNKLFRVSDPRGFTVEVPTGNIATLLHHTSVEKGKILDKCVWGRDGTNHILLPINSEPYLESLKYNNLETEKVTLSKLSKGDIVKTRADDCTEDIYIGKVKVIWEIQKRLCSTQKKGYWGSVGYRRDINSDKILETIEMKDTKFRYLFRSKDKPSYKKGYSYYLLSSGKKLVTGKYTECLDLSDVDIHMTKEVKDVIYEEDNYGHPNSNGEYSHAVVKNLEFKKESK